MKVLVTPHATRAYQARVEALTDERAEAEIVAALQAPAFRTASADGALTLWGAYNRRGFPILIATDPADEGAEFLLVRTCGPFWLWHEARRQWQQIRGRKARRRSCDRLSPADALR